MQGLLVNTAVGIASLIALVASAEVVVSKMEGVAKHYGISEVVIAMTIVSIGTSLPEISLHVVASLKILLSAGTGLEILGMNITNFLLASHSEILGFLTQIGVLENTAAQLSEQVYLRQSGTVLGASIGSDVVQETLVVGLVIISSALLAKKRGLEFSKKFLKRDYAPMVGTTFLLLILALDWRGLIGFLAGGPLQIAGTLTRLDGIILGGTFAAYMYYLYTTRKEKLASQGDVEPSTKPKIDLMIGFAAMVVVIFSADAFLNVVEVAMKQTGLSGSMIGVAAVGIVTAFPEMVTAISGLRHGSEGISLGTLIGSNITNPLLAIGSGAAISTYAVPTPLVLWDLPMEAVLAGVPVVYMFTRSSLGNFLGRRAEFIGMEKTAERLKSADNRVISIAGAVVLIMSYFFYLYVRFKYFPHDF